MEPEKIKTEEAKALVGREKALAFVNIAVFVLLIVAGGIVSLTMPKEKVSEMEKRTLTPMPLFSWHALFYGGFTDSLDLYYADNFPYRQDFLNLSDGTRGWFGILDQELGIYNVASLQNPGTENDDDLSLDPEVALTNPDPAANTSGKATSSQSKGHPKAAQAPAIPDKQTNDAEIAKYLLIYNGRAMQRFGGSKKVGAAYAGMINSYKKALGDEVNVYCLIPPGPVDFYLPEKYKKMSGSELKHIDYIYSRLDTNVTGVETGTELAAHKDEYLYFNTDHHWTGRGAYYAYRSFCRSAGLTPYELDEFQRRIIHGFVGSLYLQTRDPRLSKDGDSVEYFRLPVATTSYVYQDKELTNPLKSKVLVEYAKGVNGYSVFLGGDYPLTRIESSVKNGRKMLIVKDSYGNAIAPFFALHYEEVYVVDYRYFTANLINLIKANKITDLIFLHNGFVSNSKYTIQKEMYWMKSPQNAPPMGSRAESF